MNCHWSFTKVLTLYPPTCSDSSGGLVYSTADAAFIAALLFVFLSYHARYSLGQHTRIEVVPVLALGALAYTEILLRLSGL